MKNYIGLKLLCGLWTEKLVTYMADIDLPKLSEEDSTALETGITVEEAIASFPPRKSPGLDGLPSEWYNTFRFGLAPRLLKVFNAARLDGRLPLSMREALVVLIPKGGKTLENVTPIVRSG